LLSDLPIAGRCLAFSPDERFLAIGGPERNVLLWDLSAGKLARTLETAKAVWSISFSLQGDRLVTAGWGDRATVFDVTTGKALGNLVGHTLTVWSAAFSPNGAELATSSSDQTIRLWNAASFQPTAVRRGHQNEVWSVAFNPEGGLLASG